MSDRLNELQRQRALAQEQLAWFDREIARERGVTIPPETPKPAASAASTLITSTKAVVITSTAETDAQAADIIQRFQKTERPIKDDVRRGCYLYFFSAFLLLGLAAYAFYLLHRPAE